MKPTGRLPTSGWLAALTLFAAVPLPLAAQGAPGGRAVGADRNRAEFIDAVNTEVGETMRRWRAAWRGDRPEDIAQLYTEDAVIRPPHSAALRGRDLVERYMGAALPLTGDVRTSSVDMDASGDLGWFHGIWQHEGSPTPGAGGETQWSGGYAMLLRLEGRTWRIRSQVFFAPPGQAVPGLPAVPGRGSEFQISALDPRVGFAQKSLAAFSGAWLAKDLERSVSMLDDDVTLQLFDGSRAFGANEARAALRKLYEADVGADLTMHVADFEISDPLAYVLGQYQARLSAEPDAPREPGLFVAVLRRHGAEWQIRSLIFIRE